MQLLRERIIGQDAALNEIEKMLHVVKADFSVRIALCRLP